MSGNRDRTPGSPGPLGLVGIGLDSVDIARFAAVLERRPAMLERLFTASELDYAHKKARPAGSLAARFAAKEAVMKALQVGIGSLGWHDVEVLKAPGGAPSLAVGGRALALAAQKGISAWMISLTHTDTVASAVVAGLA